MPRKSNKSPKQNLQALQQPDAQQISAEYNSIKKFNDNLKHGIKEDLKTEFKDHKEIIYLFSIYDYELEHKKPNTEDIKLNLDIFKMRSGFKKYNDFIKYCDEFEIMGFTNNKDVYLIKKNKYLETLILYCNTADEDIKIHKSVSKIGLNYNEINIY